ncbi:hypothetical protein [uncultured Helicobacter sp.]|uniref:hypothetical protein n=1 Tax=uncultured Helicobacter sp. TaxID=175537 RepID=UPI0025896152|nr:hypothetical protein [uncultured Helicobacter sp.]
MRYLTTNAKCYAKLCVFLLVFVFGLNIGLAKSYIISPLPLPTEKILDINDQACNEACLKKLYNNGLLFSFIAKFSPNITDKSLLENFAQALARINQIQESQKSSHFKIALIIPRQTIGQYAVTISNTILAYLMSKKIDFEFEVFDCIDEGITNLESTTYKITQSNFDFAIAILTQQGTQNLIDNINVSFPIYIPTINKERIQGDTPKNFYFGGISYKKQLDILASIAKDSQIVEYTDDSQIGTYLMDLLRAYDLHIIHQAIINNQDASNFTKKLKTEEAFLDNTTLLLNTSASKSGLILSQIGYSKKQPKQFLSTQINFNPTILQLASPDNRKNFFVISAISPISADLVEYAALLNSDLKYDWVSYSTSVGVEFALKDSHIKKSFLESMFNNQIEYKNHIYTTKGSNFVLVKTTN